MGSYAASIYRIFCKEKIKKKYFLKINKIFRKNLNESFEIIIKGKKFEYIGYFSHNSKYENKLKLITSKKIYEIDRVFSPPSNKSLILKMKNEEKKIQKLVRFKHDNVFENFLKECLKSIKKREFNNFYNICLKDSHFRKQLL